MVGCGVLSCKSRSERKVDGITFHSFPFDPKIKMKWLDATGRQNWQPTKYSKICSVHFDDDSFIYKEKRVQLKPYSVPKKHIRIESSANQASITQQENLPKTAEIGLKYRNTPTKMKMGIKLQEVQNIQPMKLHLDSSSNVGDIILSERPAPQHADTPRKEKLLEKQLQKKLNLLIC